MAEPAVKTAPRPRGPAAAAAGFLRLFTVIRPEETAKALLLTLNSFLIIFGYYQIKAVREGLLLADNPDSVKSYLAIPHEILLIIVIKAFSRLSSKVPRHVLIARVSLFAASNLLIFILLHLMGVSVAVIGLAFFIWIGMYNLLIPAQFWGFANDIYDEAQGKRIFPLIALGASLGGVVGPLVAREIIPLLGSYGMMALTAALLAPAVWLTREAHRLDLRETRGRTSHEPAARTAPLEPKGGFRLIFNSRYLLLIALMMGLYNFINSLGEYMFSFLQQEVALRALGTTASGGVDLQNYIGVAFAGYQSLGNFIGLFIQLFLVSRIFRWVGVAGALLFLPIIALGGYGYAAFGASLVLLKWIKAFENGTDYSLMKTTRSALFLVTSREEKYKALAAIETFFVRGGDALCAVVVWLGTAALAMPIKGFAAVNAAAVVLWIWLCLRIVKERRKKAAGIPARDDHD